MRKINMLGQRFGRLTVIAAHGNIEGRTAWLCLCDCGNQVVTCGDRLRGKNKTSCGNHQAGCPLDPARGIMIEPGSRFGRWTAIERVVGNKKWQWAWRCVCDCGSEGIVAGFWLRNGASRSCGCYGKSRRLEGLTKHGMSRTVVYRMLKEAKRRAARLNLPFNLGIDDMPSVPELCPILGIALRSGAGKKGPRDCSPSLDRIIPALGYIKGNVRIISNRANQLRSNATVAELQLILADAISVSTIKAA